MKWTRLLHSRGWSVPTVEGGNDIDPFSMLAQGETKARISYSVKAGGYGEIFVNVSIECPQSEPHINLAAELVFRKAVELANDGASHLGIPGVTPVED